jgi:lipoprotein-releasing system permease protein
MFWGNVLAMIIYFAQTRFGILHLDPETYYTDTVPMLLNGWVFVALNVATLLASLLVLIAPTVLITKIYPAASMRYE